MCKARNFYYLSLYLVLLVHFCEILLLPYLFENPIVATHFFTATSGLLLLLGTLSNAITIKYLAKLNSYKNRYSFLWVVFLIALTIQHFIDLLVKLLHSYVYEKLPQSWTTKEVDLLIKAVGWLKFIGYFFYCIKLLTVIEIALLRFIKLLTGKSVTRPIVKIVTLVIPIFLAIISFTVKATLHVHRKDDLLSKKYFIEAIIRTLFLVMTVIDILAIIILRCLQKFEEKLEFSSHCFLVLFIMSTYDVIVYFMQEKFKYYVDLWTWVVFASYGIVMYFMDNNFKKAVHGQNNERQNNNEITTRDELQIGLDENELHPLKTEVQY